MRRLWAALAAGMLAAVLGAGPVRADAPPPPPLPMTLFGTVLDADGAPVASGTLTPYLGGQSVGQPSPYTFVSGSFGSSAPYAGDTPSLAVVGSAAQAGQTVLFSVNGAPAQGRVVQCPAGGPGLAPGSAVLFVPGAICQVVVTLLGGLGGGAAVTPTPGGSADTTGGGAPPVVSAVSPSQGRDGTTVAVSGRGFMGATEVLFGQVPALRFQVAGDTTLTAVVPPGSGTVDVVVVTASGRSAAVPGDAFTYQQPPLVPPTFADVPTTYWAAAAIGTLAAKGILQGFPDGSFRPDRPVTRAEMVKMLDLVLGITPGGPLPPFRDVTAGDGFAPYVAAAVHAGLVQGVDADTFAPDQPVTREQAAVLLARALSLSGGGTLPFTDAASIDPWAMGAVEAAVHAGYLHGFPDGTFRPLDPLTRAQAAALLAPVAD
jgi:hypothetical protein